MQNSYDNEKEQQATECLRAGAAERGLLLALATKLAGNAEDGEDLYQQSLLDCHDAIQRKGFVGTNYKFYILQSIKWGNVERQRAAQRLTSFDGAALGDQQLTSAPQVDALAALAAEVEQELTAEFAPADVAAFRLHVAGHTYREMEQLTGRNYTWLSRKVNKMKEALRTTFAQTWANLDPSE